ncbi:DUF481 domain-containing protein [Persephonella sp.]
MRKIAFYLIWILPFSPVIGGENGRKWDAHLEFAYVKTSGNTQTDTMASKFNFDYKLKSDRFYLKGESLYKKDDGKESANKINVDGRWERVIHEDLFWFLNFRYEMDKFSGYDYRISGGPGLGYDIIKDDKKNLKSLLSLNNYYDKYSEGDTDNYSSVKVEGFFDWQIKKDLKYRLDVNYIVSLRDNQNYFINGETGMEVKLNRILSMGVSYKIKYQNKPPEKDIKRVDTTFLTSVIIDF